MSEIEAFWVDATEDDVAEIMKTGKPIPARVRNADNEAWREDLISGWSLPKFLPVAVWIDLDGVRWKQCQVYREPSWHADKPDPGPGFRLLEKFPPEAKLGTDEYWSGEGWMPAGSRDNDQHEQVWYRRRIEAVPKFVVGQTVRVVGPKCDNSVFRHWSIDMEKHVGKTSTIKVREKKDADWFYEISDSVVWSFREDYLEPVEPVESKPVLIRRWTVDPGDEIKLPNGRTLVISQDGFEVTQ